jgi:hypothetical protein
MPRDEIKWESSSYKSPRDKRPGCFGYLFAWLVYAMLFLLIMVIFILGMDIFLYGVR